MELSHVYEAERLLVFILSSDTNDLIVFVEANEIEVSKMVCQVKVDEIMKYSVACHQRVYMLKLDSTVSQKRFHVCYIRALLP